MYSVGHLIHYTCIHSDKFILTILHYYFSNSYSLSPVDDTEGDMFDADSESEWQEENEPVHTSRPLWVLPLYSLLPSHQQARVCNICIL